MYDECDECDGFNAGENLNRTVVNVLEYDECDECDECDGFNGRRECDSYSSDTYCHYQSGGDT